MNCGKDSLVVTWKLSEGLVEKPFKLLLGDCFPSKFLLKPKGGGEALFDYHYYDCLFRKTVHGSLYILNTFDA